MSKHKELTDRERMMLRFIAWFLWRVGMGEIKSKWTSEVAQVVYHNVAGTRFLMKDWEADDFASYFKFSREARASQIAPAYKGHHPMCVTSLGDGLDCQHCKQLRSE